MAVAKKGQMYQTVPIQPPTHNIFPLDHEVLATIDMTKLYCIMCRPVNPSERYKCSLSAFVRMMPMQAPMMGEINWFAHAFFVPSRIMNRQKHWDDFITGGREGKLDILPKCFTPARVLCAYRDYYLSDGLDPSDWFTEMNTIMGQNSLWSYLGYPSFPVSDFDETLFDEYIWHVDFNDNVAGDDARVTYEPFFGYHLIWSEYYRDQNITEAPEFLDDIKDSMGELSSSEIQDLIPQGFFSFRNRALEKDYFTSALPQPQRGIDVPIPTHTDNIEFVGTGYVPFTSNISNVGSTQNPLGIPPGVLQTQKFPYLISGNADAVLTGDDAGSVTISNAETANAVSLFSDDIAKTLSARISVVAGTINELREAIRTQEFFELSARVGNRPKELILANFGVFTPDYRLDRPQYLGGMKMPLQISQVLQTSETRSTALGDMAGHGIGAGSNFLFDFTAYEHGWLYILVSIIPRTAYFQGMPRWMKRMSRFDYYWDKFANLGEQAIEKGELYYDWRESQDSPDALNTYTFGYQSRYSELKFMNNRVLGDFQGNLKYWHLARVLGRNTAVLNETFINGMNSQYNRIFAYGADDNVTDHFLCDFKIGLTGSLPMPIYGVPKF